MKEMMRETAGMLSVIVAVSGDGDVDARLFQGLDGTFRLVPNAHTLANAKDEGPVLQDRVKVRAWTITNRTKIAPIALIERPPAF